jgi:hypothetical protein
MVFSEDDLLSADSFNDSDDLHNGTMEFGCFSSFAFLTVLLQGTGFSGMQHGRQ